MTPTSANCSAIAALATNPGVFGSDQRAGDQVADERRQAEALRAVAEHQRGAEASGQREDQIEVVHQASRATGSPHRPMTDSPPMSAATATAKASGEGPNRDRVRTLIDCYRSNTARIGSVTAARRLWTCMPAGGAPREFRVDRFERVDELDWWRREDRASRRRACRPRLPRPRFRAPRGACGSRPRAHRLRADRAGKSVCRVCRKEG